MKKTRPNLIKSYYKGTLPRKPQQSILSIWCFLVAIWVALCMVKYAEAPDNGKLFVGCFGASLIVIVAKLEQ